MSRKDHAGKRARQVKRIREHGRKEAKKAREWKRYKAELAGETPGRQLGKITEYPPPPDGLLHWRSFAIRAYLFGRHKGLCQYCGNPTRLTSAHGDFATADHVIPLCLGGTHTLGNLTLACRECNHAKADRDPIEFYVDMVFRRATLMREAS